MYFIGFGFVSLLAIAASVMELFQPGTCPTMAGGIPMCFASLALCVVTWVLWGMGGA